jgi:hypothetical protein
VTKSLRRAVLSAAILIAGLATGLPALAQGYPPPPPPPGVMLAPGAPPPMRVEVVPPPPRFAAVWQPGFWQWGGRRGYRWVPGRYVRPPRARHEWVAGHWDPRPGGSVWVGGFWR